MTARGLRSSWATPAASRVTREPSPDAPASGASRDPAGAPPRASTLFTKTILAGDRPGDEVVDALERLVQKGGVLGPGLGEVGSAPAAAPGGPRHLLDQLAGVEPNREILRHAGHQADFAVGHAADTHHSGAQSLPEAIDDGPQAFGIEPVHAGRDDRDAVDLTGPGHQIVGTAMRGPALQLGQLLFQGSLPLHELTQ